MIITELALQIEFANKHLRELYENGRSRKYRLPEAVIRAFMSKLEKLEESNDIYELMQMGSLNFEKLRGRTEEYSIRVNLQYRLVFNIVFSNPEKTTGTLRLLDLTNHYGD